MSDETQYALSGIDTFKVVVAGGIWDVEYNIKQVQDDGYAMFKIPQMNKTFETDTVQIGENISLSIAQSVVDILDNDVGVYGFIVPDHLLWLFLSVFSDKEVYRE